MSICVFELMKKVDRYKASHRSNVYIVGEGSSTLQREITPEKNTPPLSQDVFYQIVSLTFLKAKLFYNSDRPYVRPSQTDSFFR